MPRVGWRKRLVYWLLYKKAPEPRDRQRERAAAANLAAFREGQRTPPGRTYHIGGYDDE